MVFSDKSIVHDEMKPMLALIKDALARPRCEKPCGYALLAPAGYGKTGLVNKARRDMGGDPSRKAGVHDRTPMLVGELPSRPTEPRVGLALARACGLPVLDGPQGITDAIIRVLLKREVKLLVLLEFDNIAPLPPKEREVTYDFVRAIINVGIVVVAVGTELTANLISEDEELATRLRPVRLKGFAFDDHFRSFLRTLEAHYPLPQPSYLWRDFDREIYKRTGGVLGEIVMLANEAAAWAIRNERLAIDAEALQRCNYFPPLVRPQGTKAA